MSELVAGKPVRLSDTVLRILAPNPSVFTGPGTNSYLLGRAGGDLMVLDPGPADEAHVAALLAAADALGGTIRDIVCTHTHEDHSPGAAMLAARTGARLIGNPAPDDGFNDLSFRPDLVPADGSLITCGDVSLRVVATPGHVSNHLCYLQEGDNLLFTGDHIMQGSTVVIVPPEGSMREYLASLRKLENLAVTAIAPGHGQLMHDPQQVIAATIRHRLARESKTLRALQALLAVGADDAATADILPRAYDDVPVAMHPVARLSLEAHLVKLAEDGIVRRTDIHAGPVGEHLANARWLTG